MKTKIRKIITVALILCTSYAFAGTSFLQKEKISKEKLKLFPTPNDYRNYFFLQSIANETNIIIGDFTGAQRMVVRITDRNCDNTIDRVEEYYPDSKLYKIKAQNSASQFFDKNIKKLKESIIDGSVFRNNYAYKMKSTKTIEHILSEGGSIVQQDEGYNLKYLDPDLKSSIIGEFFFQKKLGKYDLVFKTNYYKLFKAKVRPPLLFSVYARQTTDPVIKEAVEKLLKKIPK